jgi:hypothetical protein
MLVRRTATDDISNRDLEHIGYQFVATDGRTWLWYRDRLGAARAALDRTRNAPDGRALGL